LITMNPIRPSAHAVVACGLLFGTFPSLVHGQAGRTVRGTVTAEADGKPVSDALLKVIDPPSGRFTHSSASGRFRAGARGYVLKSDADRELVAAVDCLQRHRSFRSPSLETPAPHGRSDAQGEEDAGDWGDLTPREREIVQLVAEGRSSKDVGALLGISVKTVESHRTNVMRKLRIRSVSQLVRYAVRNGLVQA
jgi:DNA-binding CsgD family transcriptional regulator